MSYKVEIKRSALKKLKKMDKQVSAYLVSWIEKNLVDTDNPRAIGEPLKGDKKGFWKYKIGVYRIVADIQDKKMTILIVRAGHRKDVYKR